MEAAFNEHLKELLIFLEGQYGSQWGHLHIESSNSLRQIDTSWCVGLAFLKHEISIFVKILLNFKKKILA